MDDHPVAGTEQQTDDDQPALRTSALFALGAVAVLIIGSARPFVTLLLPAPMPSESAQLALLRLQYELFGATIFCVYAALYRWFERGGTRPEQPHARLGFWLMVLGFNLAFLPASGRGPAPALLTQPDVLLTGQAGALPLLGTLTFIGGCLVCMWTLKSEWHGGRAKRRGGG
jgi:hypothetical protein